MAKKDVSPVNGKYTIKGKQDRDLVLEFVNPVDTNTHIVEELTDADLLDKLPSPPPTWNGQPINWIANFSVYKKKNGNKNGYANVPYTISLTVESGTSYFVYYDNAVHEITDELKRTGKAILTAGDPPTGQIP
jgi:hypothetical protein